MNETVAWPLPGTADAPVGGPGTDTGITAVDAADSTEFPIAFVAWTVKV